LTCNPRPLSKWQHHFAAQSYPVMTDGLRKWNLQSRGKGKNTNSQSMGPLLRSLHRDSVRFFLWFLRTTQTISTHVVHIFTHALPRLQKIWMEWRSNWMTLSLKWTAGSTKERMLEANGVDYKKRRVKESFASIPFIKSCFLRWPLPCLACWWCVLRRLKVIAWMLQIFFWQKFNL